MDDDDEIERILREELGGSELPGVANDASNDAVGPRPADLDNLEDWT